MNNDYGPFKKNIQDFITLKQSLGYDYFTEAQHLKRFDAFTADIYSSATSLTKDIVMAWCTKKAHEKQQTLCSRASIIRQFGIYMNTLDERAYVIPKNYFKSGQQYTPYIYTHDELNRFFKETDRCDYCSECPYRHLIMPILFRMIYSCGLRVSEARSLKVNDIDLDHGILTIHQSKNDISRLVPMTEAMRKKCQAYSDEVHLTSRGDDYYFQIKNGRPLTHSNVYKNFRKFLFRAGISHGGKGVGPRIHDFRHTFAVHCLKKWSLENRDLMVYLPILRTYLGHASFNETAYYLRMTADVFPQITLKLGLMYDDLIPVIGETDHEAN